MLHFLDNQRSVGPASRAGQRGKRGLNENLGREIMELHTLGVDGGYTQTDVTSLAKILTGWSYVGPQGVLGDPGTFQFNANAHEPGPVSLLGKVYADDGVDQGRAALLDLARRPSTARFVATKLARAFIADTPPPALVERLARTFTATEGDLKAVSLALIAAPEAWVPQPGKVRSPFEILVATDRLLGRLPEDPGPDPGTATVDGHGAVGAAKPERLFHGRSRLGLARGDEAPARLLRSARQQAEDAAEPERPARRALRGRARRRRPRRPSPAPRAASRA